MIKRILAAAALALVLQPAAADTDPSQSDMRINPQLEITENSMDYSGYSFLNIKADTIEMNGADWSAIKERFAAAAAGDTCFSIVYLGDSHIQADFGGSVFRKRIAETAGSAGRGIIIPFRLAGTNQPNDYTISSGDPVVSSRLLKQPWATEMPFTGIGIQPTGGEMTAHITCDETFDRIRLLWRGQEPTITAVYGSSVDDAVEFRQTSASEIVLDMPATDIHLRIASPADMVLAGMILSNGNTGTFVHSIGNNGATYSTYNQISSFGDELSALSPDLVIIALGTNEAFGRFTAESLANDIDLLVNSIRSHNPDAGIILVTPTECYKKTYRRRR